MPDWVWYGILLALVVGLDYKTWARSREVERARVLTLIYDLEVKFENTEETRTALRILKEYVNSNERYVPWGRDGSLDEIPLPRKE